MYFNIYNGRLYTCELNEEGNERGLSRCQFAVSAISLCIF